MSDAATLWRESDLRTNALEERIEELEASSGHVETFRHADGSATVIVWDELGYEHNPREYDGNVATLIQQNDRYSAIDDDDAGLSEARDRFNYYHHKYDRETLVDRYIAMFRPDIAYYTDHWSGGHDAYGWGYVTTDRMAGLPCTAKEAFDQEVDIYRQWAEGEVYGAHHLTMGEPVVTYGPEGAYVSDWTVDEDSCWGFLGYDDLSQITEQFTDSPIVDTDSGSDNA